MTFDHIPLRETLRAAPDSPRTRAVAYFLSVIERLFRGTVTIDPRTLFNEDPGLNEIAAIAGSLQRHGILKGLQRVSIPADEPRFTMWRAEYGNHESGGGISTSSDVAAVTAAVAETLERAIWALDRSYATKKTHATSAKLTGAYLAPKQFTGVMRTNAETETLMESPYTWIQGTDLAHDSAVWIPAQTVSRAFATGDATEPRIRPIITTGLATGTDRTNALLGGLLECIERDAFMIMWGNQLSLPRLRSEELSSRSPSLQTLLRSCARYSLTVEFVRLITDAPASVVLAVVRDPRALPPITIGMSAHSRPEHAAEKALLEALRARVNTRNRLTRTPQPSAGKSIRGGDRSVFWAQPSHAPKLDFLTAGESQSIPSEACEADTASAHLARIVEWCRRSQYACASVSMTRSHLNVTPWHVEHVVIPELQPMHYDESFQTFSGTRMRTIPEQFGFSARTTPFVDLPHPFV